MNSVKIAYIVCSTLFELAMVVLAVAAPIWLTPGYYWWTAFGILIMFATSYGFSTRLNSWQDFGKS